MFWWYRCPVGLWWAKVRFLTDKPWRIKISSWVSGFCLVSLYFIVCLFSVQCVIKIVQSSDEQMLIGIDGAVWINLHAPVPAVVTLTSAGLWVTCAIYNLPNWTAKSIICHVPDNGWKRNIRLTFCCSIMAETECKPISGFSGSLLLASDNNVVFIITFFTCPHQFINLNKPFLNIFAWLHISEM